MILILQLDAQTLRIVVRRLGVTISRARHVVHTSRVQPVSPSYVPVQWTWSLTPIVTRVSIGHPRVPDLEGMTQTNCVLTNNLVRSLSFGI